MRWIAVVVGASIAIVLGVPALAFSGQFGSLFGFSNEGTSVDKNELDLRTAAALKSTGASGDFKLLASRAGIGVYAASASEGKSCLFVGPPHSPDERGLSGGCLNAAASANFPSTSRPVIDMSALFYKPGSPGEGITRLAGIAADGVATMQALGVNCQVIAEAPVQDNVYARSDLPDTPVVGIVGLTQTGQRAYLKKLQLWEKSVC